MIKKYKLVDLDDAQAGMVLSSDVFDHQSSVLLPAGAALTEALLKSMRRRGIDSVQVVDDTVSSQELTAEREFIAGRLTRLFRRPGASAADAMLHGEIGAYRIEGLQ